MLQAKLLLLLLVANGAPVLVYDLLRGRWAAPVDCKRVWWDGRPLLGGSCTWRGWFAALAATPVAAALLGLPMVTGLTTAKFRLPT